MAEAEAEGVRAAGLEVDMYQYHLRLIISNRKSAGDSSRGSVEGDACSSQT